MKLACAVVDGWGSVEVYYDPGAGSTWERILHHANVGAKAVPQPVWFEGPCWSQQLPIRRPGMFEKRREEIIAETRARVTRAERVDAIWAIMETGQVIPDAANILPIISSYLLALYPAIIPEDIATVESWVPQFGSQKPQFSSFGTQKPQYDFSGVRCGDVIPTDDKNFHKFDWCRHIDCGYAVVNGEKMPIEKCLMTYTSYVCAAGFLGDNVLWCAHVSRLANCTAIAD